MGFHKRFTCIIKKHNILFSPRRRDARTGCAYQDQGLQKRHILARGGVPGKRGLHKLVNRYARPKQLKIVCRILPRVRRAFWDFDDSRRYFISIKQNILFYWNEILKQLLEPNLFIYFLYIIYFLTIWRYLWWCYNFYFTLLLPAIDHANSELLKKC